VTSVEAGAIPERCSYGARIDMVDCVDVMIAGAGGPVVRLVAATVANSTQNEGAPEILTGRNLAGSNMRPVSCAPTRLLEPPRLTAAVSLRDLPLVARD
jgi:hypothetical protein